MQCPYINKCPHFNNKEQPQLFFIPVWGFPSECVDKNNCKNICGSNCKCDNCQCTVENNCQKSHHRCESNTVDNFTVPFEPVIIEPITEKLNTEESTEKSIEEPIEKNSTEEQIKESISEEMTEEMTEEITEEIIVENPLIFPKNKSFGLKKIATKLGLRK